MTGSATAVDRRLPIERVGEIPTRPSVSKATVVSVAAAMLFPLGAAMWHYGSGAFLVFLSRNGEIAGLFGRSGMIDYALLIFPVFGLVGVACLVAGAVSLVRTRVTYALLRSSLLVVYPAVLGYVLIAWSGIFSILEADIWIDAMKQDRATAIKLWWHVSWPALAIGLYVLWLHLLLASRSVHAAFTGKRGGAMEGDRILEDIRTHGREPEARRGLYRSSVAHIAVLIVVPYLLETQGCVEPYRVPKGSGQQTIAVMMKKVKRKKKKKKKLQLRKNSAFIFEVPDLFEETHIDKVMDASSQDVYVAGATPGRLGKGGGTKGGWPEGMEGAKVRVIRLEHGGRGWDDGMRDSGADENFLRHFHKATGFKVSRRGESHAIALLRKYPPDGFPPFVFMTGNHWIGRVSKKDIEILRNYCLKGGMLIADAGSNTFDRSFRGFVRQVFPGKALIDIADDDPIYQQPTRFPDGAPSFWHHGGSRAMGIKHEGRWVVFYHPGDMNDAWKNAGYSDLTPEMRRNAMKLGINLVNYAFNQWNDAVARLRK